MSMTRREFVKRSTAAGVIGAAAFTILPRRVLGGPGQTAPSGKVTLAGVGVGGVGFSQLQSCDKAGFQIVALCDVDDVYAKKAFDRWPQARRYRDYREMLQAEGDKIDAVHCGTPDHTHAVITLAALRRKKHVCCVKPLTRTLHECRTIVTAAREARVATQVTASPNTSETACRTCELITAGAIGAVREVHIWTNRPLWPHGMERPAGEDPVPKTLDWDLWIGPAPMRPFKDTWPDGALELKQVGAKHSKGVYHPWNFRGWWDFGTGALGDMGCHHLNTPYRALNLKHPTSVYASSTRVLAETAPLASVVTYEFPAREGMPPVRVVWYDGGLKPPYPPELEGKPMPDQGVLYLGDKGKMLGADILPALRAKQFESVPKTLPRRSGTWGEWFDACRGGEPAGCNFEWAGPLTEFVLLGNIAIRTGKWLAWDGEQQKFTNHEAANKFIQEPYRGGWSL
ncbi:MAG: Gfo/Idh/MocA family oxidoreductase [Verrucomicrobia bacterium]|nr:Gfo/Idh/MocA family oxidoreductase [Verrucomicrobiota bacterium]